MSILERFSLRGRIALVTAGAGPQFGQSISEGLVEAGATLISASRSLERNESFAEGLRQRGYDAHALQVDITQMESIQRLHDRVIERFGRLDVLVNSARAVLNKSGGFEDETPDDWALIAQGDLVGLTFVCKLFLKDMVRQGKGSIINVSSIYGVVGNDPTLYEGTNLLEQQSPYYNFTKGGMINFTRYLANFYGKLGVRANCISPGGYFNNQPEAFVERYCKRVPVGRMMNREDLKGAVVFLASDASEYVTGINLMVDGGWTTL
jgi:NAD(P)-dependent dehydrogenase (short-subunit alcohol dehydrogenase family)